MNRHTEFGTSANFTGIVGIGKDGRQDPSHPVRFIERRGEFDVTDVKSTEIDVHQSGTNHRAARKSELLN